MDSRARDVTSASAHDRSQVDGRETPVPASRLQLVPVLPPDPELVAHIGGADESVAKNAFSALYAAYCVVLCKWAYYFTQDRAAAEEAVADVLAALWHRRESWMPQGSVESYLFAAVRTHLRQQLRNSTRQAQLATRFVAAGESPAMSASIAPTDAAAQSNELRVRLDRALAGLSGRSRAAVMYRWYDGLEYDEIAQRLGTTEGAVRVLVTRALKTLRTLIEPA